MYFESLVSSKAQLVRDNLSKFHFLILFTLMITQYLLRCLLFPRCTPTCGLWWCCVNMCHVNFTWSRWTDSNVRRYGILSICIDSLHHPRLIGRTTQLACEQPRRTDSKVSHISSVCLCHWWTC